MLRNAIGAQGAFVRGQVVLNEVLSLNAQEYLGVVSAPKLKDPQ